MNTPAQAKLLRYLEISDEAWAEVEARILKRHADELDGLRIEREAARKQLKPEALK